MDGDLDHTHASSSDKPAVSSQASHHLISEGVPQNTGSPELITGSEDTTGGESMPHSPVSRTLSRNGAHKHTRSLDDGEEKKLGEIRMTGEGGDLSPGGDAESHSTNPTASGYRDSDANFNRSAASTSSIRHGNKMTGSKSVALGTNPNNSSYAGSQLSGKVVPPGEGSTMTRRHNSHHTTSSQSSMMYHAVNGILSVPPRASTSLSFHTDSENYDLIPHDITEVSQNTSRKTRILRLIRVKTTTGIKNKSPPSATTAGGHAGSLSVKKGTPGKKWGYGWGVGRKNKEKAKLAQVEEVDTERRLFVSGDQSRASMPSGLMRHESNTKSPLSQTWDPNRFVPPHSDLTREISGRSGRSGFSSESGMRGGGVELSRTGTGNSGRTGRSGTSDGYVGGTDLHRSATGSSGRSIVGLYRKVNGAFSRTQSADVSRATMPVIDTDDESSPAPSNSSITSAYQKMLHSNAKTYERVETGDRLYRLRRLMSLEKEPLDFYVVPNEDAHQSEYVAASDKRCQYICGFSGANGHAIVTPSQAFLVADRRYWDQALAQIDPNWTLIKAGSMDQPLDWIDWLASVIGPNSRIGIDGRMISYEKATLLKHKIKLVGAKLVYPTRNLVDLIWKERPTRMQGPVYIHGRELTGEDASSKLQRLRDWIRSQPPNLPKLASSTLAEPKPNQTAIGTLISSLPAIAYLLNLRGSDMPYNPLFHAYLFVSLDPAHTTLFIDSSKVVPEVESYLANLRVQRKDYVDIWSFLRHRQWDGEGKLIISPQTSYTVSLVLTRSRSLMLPSHVEHMMSIKNPTELDGMKRAYLKDGVAFIRFLAWLESKLAEGYHITEWEAAHRLTEFRRNQKQFMELAYETISASGKNAALPHYVPMMGEAKAIDRTHFYLIDSGSQYRDGTCSTARTVHFGRPTEEVCEVYTRVLQGHIAIDITEFPEGTSGLQLDVLARRELWKEGRDYVHGTSPEFGSLTVHQGPHGFNSAVPLTVGHIVANDSGFYEEGEFGICIKSGLAVKRLSPKRQHGGKTWLGFERLTCVPIQTKMVKENMLNKEEKQWLKRHNQRERSESTEVAQARSSFHSFLRADLGSLGKEEARATSSADLAERMSTLQEMKGVSVDLEWTAAKGMPNENSPWASDSYLY
ncbi:hypothetical protein AAF712_002935 [Marasmius tenuissimus]|uniref:Creatinase/aminopeptidase n=1 Tax=Marasmius tenuissimus TaxID=585030 RepID=A0ABR3AAL2_9AGAR